MDAVKLHAVAAFAAGLIITLFVAAYLTPNRWWRRPNARALLILVAGAWGFGSLILYAVPPPASASQSAASPAEAATMTATTAPVLATRSAEPPAAGQPFHVHRDLNLRAAPGVNAARLAVVPAGATITPTGKLQGDWWQIETTIDGRARAGWVSSLWLRRSGE